jgi:L-malate glycosyltransferase
VRLCFIANYSIHTRRLMRYFVEQGHDVHLITVRSPEAPVLSGLTLHDLTATIDRRKVRYPIWSQLVRRIVRQLDPEILHAHQVANAGWLGAASGHHPFMVTAWGSDLLVNPHRSWMQRQLARWVLKRADYVTCVSQSLAQAAVALGADPRRLEVAPWGIDTDVFCPARSKRALRHELGWGPGPLVLSPRSLKPVYNPLDIARAIPGVLAEFPTAQFIIRTHICDPRLLTRFQAVVAEQHAEHAVSYISDLPDESAIADLYRAANVVVSVPSSDGTPSSVLEALACGAVPVLSDVASLHEWVKHEVEALFVPVGDVRSISQAVVRLLKDERMQNAMRARGINLVRSRADSRVWMQHYEEIYHHLVEGSAGHET